MDTVEAGYVGACDGELTVGQLLDALAELTRADATDLRVEYLPRVRALVVDGLLGTAAKSAGRSRCHLSVRPAASPA